jgi:hypothetical protein
MRLNISDIVSYKYQIGSSEGIYSANLHNYCVFCADEAEFGHMPTDKTTAAFNTFRAGRAAKALPAALVSNADQIKQMAEADGLLLWQDGTAKAGQGQEPGTPPTFTSRDNTEKVLWVICESDVLACTRFG